MKTVTHNPSSPFPATSFPFPSFPQPLEFHQTHSTQYVIYLNDLNLGAIAFNITASRWEYTPFSCPVKATGTLEQCRIFALNDLQPHPYSYSHATPSSLPPRFHIEHHPGQGYRAHFNPLTPGPTPESGNTTLSILPTHYSEYFPTAELALKAHLSEYIEDLVQFQAFQTLLALAQRFDGEAVINAFELLKQINPDEDYYLDAAAGRVEPVSEL
ncbi:MAG: hypothetical protein AAGF93_02185 [Cyanobacteria bacterium P01_H01_bin.105]